MRAGGQEKRLATGIRVGQVVLEDKPDRLLDGKRIYEQEKVALTGQRRKRLLAALAGWLAGWLAGQGTRHEAIDDLSKVQRVPTVRSVGTTE